MVSPRSGVTKACTRRVEVRGIRSRAGLPFSVGVTAMSDSWREVAACAETGPEAFFPAKGESARPAKRICWEVCEVREACLQKALDTGDVEHGVLGGLSARERRALRNELRDAA